jgi:hypothetical protein
VAHDDGVVFAAPAGSVADLRFGLANAFRRVAEETGRTPASRLLGLPFAPDGAPLTRDQVIPRLGQLHWRSGQFMDLFCAGYGRRGGTAHLDATFRTVLDHGPDGEWLFSDHGFDDVRREVEEVSGWRYSGEVDLLVVNARLDVDSGEALVDFRSGAEIRLANAIADGAIGLAQTNTHRRRAGAPARAAKRRRARPGTFRRRARNALIRQRISGVRNPRAAVTVLST